MAMPSSSIKPKLNLKETHRIKTILRKYNLHTVCEESFCPNISECFGGNHTATFLLMGSFCTRHCSFCGIRTSKNPPPLDPEEPEKLKKSVLEMGLKFVVLTSVNRDDLEDFGANHLAKCIRSLKSIGCEVEILSPDLNYHKDKIDIVLDAKPEIFAHNIETVPRLYPSVRPWGDFRKSVELLRYAKSKGFITKTSLIVGLGEEYSEILEAVRIIKLESDCDIITVGQYFQPTKSRNQNVIEMFDKWKDLEDYCKSLGFFAVVGPNVRSSYIADKVFKEYRIFKSLRSNSQNVQNKEINVISS